MDKQQVISKFQQLAFTCDWKRDEARLHNEKEHLVVRPTLRLDEREVDFEFFNYNERNGEVSFGYIVSGEAVEVYTCWKRRNKTATEAKWRACWARAQREQSCHSTLLPIVKTIFDDDGRY